MKKMNIPTPSPSLDNNCFPNEQKILILYILSKIPKIKIRKIIWKKLIEHEEEEINNLIRQSWYDDINIALQELDENIGYTHLLYDLENYYST